MKFEEVRDYMRSIGALNIKEIDVYCKKLIMNHEDVSDLESHILEDIIVYRPYFGVSLSLLNNYQEQFEFIEKKSYLFQEWWNVDILIQYMFKPIPFEYGLSKAATYVNSDNQFLRRWGYVLFFLGMIKTNNELYKVLELFKDDDAYYVQMAEAWLMSDIAVYRFDIMYEFLNNSKIKYNILGKAIQKICDSYRITPEQKEAVKKLRVKLKTNK